MVDVAVKADHMWVPWQICDSNVQDHCRFLLESGSIKLFVRCPLWWNFTALRHHFETLPLPTPLSWYSFNHPVAVMKVGNIFTNLTELVCSWFFFFPHRTVRRYVFYWQVGVSKIYIDPNAGAHNLSYIADLSANVDNSYRQLWLPQLSDARFVAVPVGR